jgi:hypothetical protein
MLSPLHSYGTLLVGGAGLSNPPPPTHTHSLAGLVTLNAKTTVHCSPGSSIASGVVRYR